MRNSNSPPRAGFFSGAGEEEGSPDVAFSSSSICKLVAGRLGGERGGGRWAVVASPTRGPVPWPRSRRSGASACLGHRSSTVVLWMLGGHVLCLPHPGPTSGAYYIAQSCITSSRDDIAAARSTNPDRSSGNCLPKTCCSPACLDLFGLLYAFEGIRLIRAFGPANLPRLNEVSVDLPRPRLGPGQFSCGGNPGGTGASDTTCAVTCVRLARRVAEVSRAEHPAVEFAAPSWWRSSRLQSFCSSAPVCSSEAGGTSNNIDPGFTLSGSLSWRSPLRRPSASPRNGRTCTTACSNRFRRCRAWRAPVSSTTCSLPTPGNRSSLSSATREGFRAPAAHERRGQCGFLQSPGNAIAPRPLFSIGDRPEAPPVAIINDAMARRSWPGQDPVGRRFKLGPRIPTARGTQWWAWSATCGGRGWSAKRSRRSSCRSRRIPLPERGHFHKNVVGRSAGDGRGTSSGRSSRREECADLWRGASGTAARNLPHAASLPDLAPDRLLHRGATDGRCRDIRAHPVLDRDAHTGNRLAHGHRRTARRHLPDDYR